MSYSEQEVGKFFCKLPEEAIMKILEFTVTFDKPIKPAQVCDGSNKFVYGKYEVEYMQGVNRKVSTEEQKLAVCAAMATCKTFYDLLNTSAAFYKMNTFDFASPKDLLVYLSSITIPRMKDLRDVVVQFPYYMNRYPRPRSHLQAASTLLATCSSLQSLTLAGDVTGNEWAIHKTFTASNSLLIASEMKSVRCQNLQVYQKVVGLQVYADAYSLSTETVVQQVEANRISLENRMKDITSQPPVEIKERDIVAARQQSGVHIHGDGRLAGELLKPGVISSRTRAGKAKVAQVDEDGLVKKRAQPKFSLEGGLVWDVKEITGHKEAFDEETSSDRVQLYVSWKLPHSEREGATDDDGSWEYLEDLASNPRNFIYLYHYYTEPHGKKETRWGKVGGAPIMLEAARKALGEEKTRREGKRRGCDTTFVKFFESGVRAHEKYLANMEEEAARAAAKAEKDAAKATKAKRKRKTSEGVVEDGKAVGKKRMKRKA